MRFIEKLAAERIARARDRRDVAELIQLARIHPEAGKAIGSAVMGFVRELRREEGIADLALLLNLPPTDELAPAALAAVQELVTLGPLVTPHVLSVARLPSASERCKEHAYDVLQAVGAWKEATKELASVGAKRRERETLVVRELLDFLRFRGSEVTSERKFSMGSATVLDLRPLRIEVVLDRTFWEIYAGTPGKRFRMDVWQAALEHTAPKIGPEEAEWQCTYLREHLDDMLGALAGDARRETLTRLGRIREEIGRLRMQPTPRDPLFVEAGPRPGVLVKFGIDRHPAGVGLIFARISISNSSDDPFLHRAGDFRLSMDGRLVHQYVAGWAIPSGEIPPRRTEDVRNGVHWINRGDIVTLGLTYCPSDPESDDTCRTAEKRF